MTDWLTDIRNVIRLETDHRSSVVSWNAMEPLCHLLELDSSEVQLGCQVFPRATESANVALQTAPTLRDHWHLTYVGISQHNSNTIQNHKLGMESDKLYVKVGGKEAWLFNKLKVRVGSRQIQSAREVDIECKFKAQNSHMGSNTFLTRH